MNSSILEGFFSNCRTIGRAAAVLSSEIPAGIVPKVLQIVPIGCVQFKDGKYSHGMPYEWNISHEDAAAMIADRGGSEILIDFEYQSLAGRQTNAAGWASGLVCGVQCLWADVSWTSKAAAHIANREYRYLSTVLLQNIQTNPRQGETAKMSIHSVSLTNCPNLPSVKPAGPKALSSLHSSPAASLTPEQLAICAAMGIAHEDYAAAKSESFNQAALESGNPYGGLDQETAAACNAQGLDPAVYGSKLKVCRQLGISLEEFLKAERE